MLISKWHFQTSTYQNVGNFCERKGIRAAITAIIVAVRIGKHERAKKS